MIFIVAHVVSEKDMILPADDSAVLHRLLSLPWPATTLVCMGVILVIVHQALCIKAITATEASTVPSVVWGFPALLLPVIAALWTALDGNSIPGSFERLWEVATCLKIGIGSWLFSASIQHITIFVLSRRTGFGMNGSQVEK
jgi:hypothetical protein